MNKLTSEQVLKAIEPKSDQLNADDLVGGPITVTIKDVRGGDQQQPIVLLIDGGHRPYKPSKTMTRVIVQLFGADPKGWIGQGLRLYRDPKVKWAGVEVGGIRISGATIANAVELMVTLSKSKREAIRIEPITITSDLNERIGKAVTALAGADEKQAGKYWEAIKRDLLPGASVEQRQILYTAMIGKLTDQTEIPAMADEARDAGCNADDIDAVADQRWQELKGGE